MPVHTFTEAVKGEDRHLHTDLPDGTTLMVVADGHGGTDCAVSAVAAIETMFHRDGVRTRLSEAGEQWRSVAEKELRDAIARAAEETDSELTGAVVTAVLVSPARDMLAWAQVGDTVAMWRSAQGEIERTPDHNCRSNVAEREAAEKRGGRYMSGYIMAPDGSGGLQPARSLGDRYMGPVASKEPDIGSATLGGGLLVSSDGIVNGIQGSVQAETAVFKRVLEQAEAGEDLEATVRAFFPGGFRDDVTVLVLEPAG